MRAIAVLIAVALAASGQSFEVASIRMYSSGAPFQRGGGNGVHPSPDGITARYTRLWAVIGWAYDIPGEVSGPDWIRSERYDITAKAAAPVPEAELRQMLQTLLADRFKLIVHRETREFPVAVLMVGKGGAKNLLPVHSGDPPQYETGNGKLVVKNASMEQFGYYLGNSPPFGVREKVLDQTALAGSFDITVNIKDFDVNDPIFGGDFEEMRRAFFPFFSNALEKQYGLKLERRKVPLQCLVVDSGNKVPTEN